MSALKRHVIELSGDVDLEHAADIRKMLLDALDGTTDLLIDLSAVTYIDSSGIASLVEALQTANNFGTKLGLVALSAQAMRVFELARLDKVFTIFPDMPTATSA